MNALVNIAVKAARSAGDIIIRGFNRLDQVKVTEKHQNDYVSEIDKQSEFAIIDTIKYAYPNHSIIAEESGKSSGNEYCWIIDPLDGTNNFIHGFPHFAVSIAIKIKDEIEHGIIFDPIRNEMFIANRGAGAQLNNRRIRVASRNSLDKCLLGTGFPFINKNQLNNYLDLFKQLFTLSSGVRRTGSAALDLAYIASARLDGFWESGLKIWDIAAGALLINEAGGIVTDYNEKEEYLESGNVVAANPKIQKSMLNIIQQTQNRTD